MTVAFLVWFRGPFLVISHNVLAHSVGMVSPVLRRARRETTLSKDGDGRQGSRSGGVDPCPAFSIRKRRIGSYWTVRVRLGPSWFAGAANAYTDHLRSNPTGLKWSRGNHQLYSSTWPHVLVRIHPNRKVDSSLRDQQNSKQTPW